MKVLDSSQIIAEIKTQISQTDYDITQILGETLTQLVVMGIYLTNDVCSGYGQDFKSLDFSIISSPQAISVITEGKMSYYKMDVEICAYESLNDDIFNILMIIQAAIDRLYD